MEKTEPMRKVLQNLLSEVAKFYAESKRKEKSKSDYILDAEPAAEQVAQIEAKVNEEIARNHDVTIEFMSREQAASIVDLSKLPEDASETLRIVRIGDYDACACIGSHVKNTSEIGAFKIISHSFENGVRWIVIQN